MVFNFRKIASVLASTIMLGSTVAIAAAADTYPAPFVKGGNADVAVVIGSRAQLTDMVAVSDISVDLQEELAKQTATVTGGTSTSATTTGGDSVSLASSSRKLYYGDALNADKLSISSSQLPNVLANGKVVDLRGTEYTYQQTIVVGARTTAYSTSGGDLDDPQLILQTTSDATSTPLYNYTLSLNKNLNVSDTVNVQGQSKIKVMGVEYIIGTDSTNTTLKLNGAGQSVSLNGGDTANFTIGGVSHTIQLVTTSSATGARIVVDGVSRDVTEGSSYAFAGGINVYVKDVTHPSFAGDIRSGEFLVGANTITLTNGQAVTYGADSTTIQGTLATITAVGPGQISGFSVAVAASNDNKDYILPGGSFTDPVFGGLKVQFAGVVPGLNDSSRSTLKIDTDNNQFARVTFTPARGGTEQTVKYVYDNDTDSASIQPILAYEAVSNDRKKIHVLEGENARLYDYIVINKGDDGTILKVEDLAVTDDSSTTNDYVKFTDVFTGEQTTVSLTNSSSGYRAISQTLGGATGYTVSSAVAASTSALNVNITWSSAATTRTLFPRIKLKNGGWMAFLTSTTVGNSTSLILPDGLTTLASTGESGRGNETYTELNNGINWTLIPGGTATTQTIVGTSNPVCNFSAAKGPAILYIEPKKWDDSTFGNFICVPLTTTGTTEIKIDTPVFNGSNSGFVTWGSDSQVRSAVDKFGAYVEYIVRTNENGEAVLKAPESQMYFDVFFASDEATITPGASGSGGGSVKSLGTPTVVDTQAASLTTKNLIVVGGSCVNSVAAQLLGSSSPVCGADFTTKTGVESGQFLIKTYSWGTGKVATLVAGFNAEDTTNAATYLRTQTVDVTVGKGVKGTTATSAQPLTESTTTNSTA